ncbi:hypothetical protein H8356DRAFT_1329871 [Neocallimastix lanati (nom. inval.)]|nr:hypothetical protein H8356DRAFT_1329871 [Neocallimastix sp. JGI-2020a]
MEENINIEIKLDKSISIAKHNIKDEIRKSSSSRYKTIYNEVSYEMRFTCTGYNYDEILNESIYNYAVRNENYIIFKNSNLIIF